MVRRFAAVAFEDDPPEDIVNFAVAPIDALTGRIVGRNIMAIVSVPSETGELILPDKPIRNLTGLLVFINLPKRSKYRIALFTKQAGYFDPDPIEFTSPLPNENSNSRDRLRVDFTLFPLPSFNFIDEATIVSGLLMSGDEVVQGARISVEFILPALGVRPNNSSAKAFETRSDERGSFALALRLPSFSENGGNGNQANKGVKVKFKIETKTNSGEWESRLAWVIQVVESNRQIFKFPIDLENTDNPIELTLIK